MATSTNDNGTKINSTARIIGFNINSLRTIIVYGDLSGMIYDSISFETPSDKPFQEAFSAITSYADKLLARIQAQYLPAPQVVSLAFNGSLDIERGLVGLSTDFRYWQNAPIKGRLAMHFNLPVFIELEPNAAALAEYYFGAGQGLRNLVFISLEPLVRLGILSDGLLYHSSGGFAGNIGAMSMSEYGPAGYGQAGSLNGYSSSAGLIELAHLRFPGIWPGDFSTDDLVDAAQNGGTNAQMVFSEAAQWLGKALVPITRVLYPEAYIIGSPACLVKDFYMAIVENSLRESGDFLEDQTPKVKAADLGKRLPQVSALSSAINHYRS